eukprot:CAMPEP_0183743818 /NCGR_PEP_ID=MMETSP0737-20130205/65413_1 /TAXON_ID=385413 /ORGANISM="Thalassiosira miniscula, Strain CCMP1093" /LENGTH=741 /DNA_ID=CAMNT_0025979447 /DNA_START=556 /DNA_END=2781 /DNA_ORIENTATION=-
MSTSLGTSSFLPDLVICENGNGEGGGNDDCGSETQSSTTSQSSDEGYHNRNSMKHKKERKSAATSKATKSSSNDHGRAAAPPKTSRSQTAKKAAEKRNEAELEITQNLTDLSLDTSYDHHQMIPPAITSSSEYSSKNAPPTIQPSPTHRPHPNNNTQTAKKAAEKRNEAELEITQNLTDLSLDTSYDHHQMIPPAITSSSEYSSKNAPPTIQPSPTHRPHPNNNNRYILEEKGTLPSRHVGRIIGKGGETIRDIQARSACHIDVHQTNVDRGAPKIITYRGRCQEDIDLAKRLVDMLCQRANGNSASGSGGGSGGDAGNDPTSRTLPLGRATMKQIRVPQWIVGRIIGKDGDMIRNLQSGRCQEDIDLAKRLVDMLCQRANGNSASGSGGGSGGDAGNDPTSRTLPLGRATMKQIRVPQWIVGRIIGKDGDMIRNLQSRSEARIQVDHTCETEQDVYPDSRRVTITGTNDSVQKAEEMILYLVDHVGSAHHPRLDGRGARKEKDWSGGDGNSHFSIGTNHNNEKGYVEGNEGRVAHPGLPMVSPAESSVASVPTIGGPYWGGEGYAGYECYDGNNNQQNQLPFQPWNTPPMQQYPIGPPPPPTSFAAAPPRFPPLTIETDVLFCDTSDIGNIIGHHGATIRDLQRRSHCDIRVHPHDRCVEITGPRMGIRAAVQMLRAIMERGSDHPFAGGRHFEEQLVQRGFGPASSDPTTPPQQGCPAPMPSNNGTMPQPQCYTGYPPM